MSLQGFGILSRSRVTIAVARLAAFTILAATRNGAQSAEGSASRANAQLTVVSH